MLALCCCGLDFSLEAKDFVESTCSLHMNLISKHVVSSSDRAGMSPQDVDLFGGLQGAEKLQKYSPIPRSGVTLRNRMGQESARTFIHLNCHNFLNT